MLGSRFADYDRIKSKTAIVLDSEDIGEIVNSAAANIVMSISFFGKKRTRRRMPRERHPRTQGCGIRGGEHPRGSC